MQMRYYANMNAHTLGHYLSPAGLLAALLSFLGMLPVIIGAFAAMAAACFYTVQFIETKTISQWIKSRQQARYHRKVARLQYRQSLIVGELKTLGVLAHAETRVELDHQTTSIETTVKSNPAG